MAQSSALLPHNFNVAIQIPDYRKRIRIGIRCGGTGAIILRYDSKGNPIIPGMTKQLYSGAFANPNGNVTPLDITIAALYYQDNDGTVNNLWKWMLSGPAIHTWIQMLA